MKAIREGRAWTPPAFAMLLLMVAWAAWTQRQPLLDILTIGVRDEEQSHIFLVPLIAGWLLWLRRSRLRSVRLRPSPVGPVLVVIGSLVSWWGLHSGIQIAWHAGAGLTLVGVVLSMTGLEPLRQFAPVFAILLFALPVPGVIRQTIAIPLQTLATTVTHASLELFGVTAIRLGNVLVINGEQIAVGEACNGMRMVFAFALVVFAFAFGTPLNLATRVLLFVLSPVTALICNVVRLVPTSLIYGFGTVGRAEWFHDITGWVMLPIALVILVCVLRLFKWLEFSVTPFRLAIQ